MINKIKYIIIGCLLLWGFGPSAQAQDRIISLKPNITEILFDLGVGDQVVGVTTFCDDPKAAQKIDKIADYVHLNLEKILLKKPTLIFGSKENSVAREIQFLKDRGIAVYLFAFDRLDSIYTSIVGIAKVLGIEGKGVVLVQSMKSQLAQIKEQAPPYQGVALLMVVGRNPLMVVGGNNMLQDLFSLLGLNNLAGSSKIPYPTYSVEKFLVKRPEVIIDVTMGTESNNAAWYERYPSLPAVQRGRVYFLDIADFRPSPRLIFGARSLIKALK